jgi:hypothetical protein
MEDLISNPAIANANDLVQFHWDASKIKSLRLLEALRRSSEAQSTEPRDKVFALLGIVYDSTLYLPVPNYRQSGKEISIGMSLSAVGTTSSLDIVPLLGCGYQNINGLPSWHPDWFHVTGTSERKIRYLLNGSLIDNGQGDKFFAPPSNQSCRAAGSTEPKLRMLNDMLRPRGITVDQIDGIIATNSEINTPPVYEGSRTKVTKHVYGSEFKLAHALRRLLTRRLKEDELPGSLVSDIAFIMIWVGENGVFQLPKKCRY